MLSKTANSPSKVCALGRGENNSSGIRIELVVLSAKAQRSKMAIAMIKTAAAILNIASLHRRCRSVKIECEETHFFKISDLVKVE